MEMLRQVTLLSVPVRIILALLVGGLLGFGRGRKNRAAGFRTYMLVCVGATLVMMTNQYVFQTYGISDPVRMGAQVVSGIGFLGAGTILVTRRNQIKGITTAAGLWTAACTGLAIGIGFYEGAVISAVAILLIMTLMQGIDARIHNRSRDIELYMEFDRSERFSEFLTFAREQGFLLHDIQINGRFEGDGVFGVVLTAESPVFTEHSLVIEKLTSAPGVMYIEKL